MKGQQFQTRIPIKRKTQRKKSNSSKVCVEDAFSNLLSAIKVTKIVLKEAPQIDASVFENIAIGGLKYSAQVPDNVSDQLTPGLEELLVESEQGLKKQRITSISFFARKRYKNEEDLAKTAVDHPKETVKGKLKNSKDVSKARNRIVKTKVKKTQASEKPLDAKQLQSANHDLKTEEKGKNENASSRLVVDHIKEPVDGILTNTRGEYKTRNWESKMTMKNAEAHEIAFEAEHPQPIQIQLESCDIVEGVENTTSELQVKSSVSQHKPLLSVQNSKDLRPASPLHSSYRLTPETMQYMVSSKDLETMREILGEKQLYGEQPWLSGRLSLSKGTCRYKLPMDLRILSRLSPMEYVTDYCVINSKRVSLYKSIFQKNDQNRDGWLSYKEFLKALKAIHVNCIDENEISELVQMLDLDDSPNAKYNRALFSGVAAFSERLALHMRKTNEKLNESGKDPLEKADFGNIEWKLRNIEVNPKLVKVLQAL